MRKTEGDDCAFPAWELNGHGAAEMNEFGLTKRELFALKFAPVIWKQVVIDGTAYRYSEWRTGVATEAVRMADELIDVLANSKTNTEVTE